MSKKQPKLDKSIIRTTLRYYFAAIKQSSGLFYLSLVLGVFAIVIQSVVLPFLYSQVFDTIARLQAQSRGESTDYLWYLLFWIGVGLALIVVLWRATTYTYMTNQARAMRYLEQSTYEKLQKHSYSFFSNRFSGALVTQTNRFVNGLEIVQDVFFWDLGSMFVRTTFFIGILLVVFPVVGLALLIWAILFITIVGLLNAYKSKYSKIAAAADSKVTAELADGITNVVNVKTFSRRSYEQQRFKHVSQDRYEKRMKSWFWDEHLRALQSVLMVSLEFFVIYWSITSALAGTVSVGVLLLTSYYVFRLFGDFWEFGNITRRLEKALSDSAEMTQILGKEIGVKDEHTLRKLTVNTANIDFKNVEFAYEKSDLKVFQKLNIHIKAGEKVGLVGPSGGGKTTLTKLLLRFVDIQSGTIEIDGQNIASVPQDELRRHIAYVPQEPILFHRSIAENIRYGNPEATDSEVQEAARLAHAAEFIDLLPDGYETLVGERGMKLSGGQKQRVAIARAMLVKAPILLLDEATSALDSKSEKLIADALDSLMKHRTTIVIAHRLSTIRKLDRILVMKDGLLTEEGTHDELLKIKNGMYAELWGHQSGDFLDE